MESWLPVVGYEGLYEISDHGRARSLDRLVPGMSHGRACIQHLKGKILSPGLWSGRLRVGLYREGKGKYFYISHLVLESFVGPREANQRGLHWDDDPMNNHLSNLRWGTQSENMHDKVRNGNCHQSNKTHCVHGHEYSPETTYVDPQGHRECRLCRQENVRRFARSH